MVEHGKDFKHLVRVVNTDLDGNRPVLAALRQIKGVSFIYANMICSLIKLDKKAITGYLPDADIQKLEDAVKNPAKYGAPVWMLNRRNDYETGKNVHLLSGDIKYVKENDIKRMKMIKSYKGVRHMDGLPVRGQLTRSNFRRNKGKVLGVKRAKKSGRV